MYPILLRPFLEVPGHIHSHLWPELIHMAISRCEGSREMDFLVQAPMFPTKVQGDGGRREWTVEGHLAISVTHD